MVMWLDDEEACGPISMTWDATSWGYFWRRLTELEKKLGDALPSLRQSPHATTLYAILALVLGLRASLELALEKGEGFEKGGE